MQVEIRFWRKDVDRNKRKGTLYGDIGPSRAPGKLEGGPEIGRTRCHIDPELLERLYAGELTINVDETTIEAAVFSSTTDPIRQAATQILRAADSDWRGSDYYRPAGDDATYEEYVRTFLEEFTDRTAHIPPRQQLGFYPSPLVLPCEATVLVARDGLAIVYEAPTRPDIVNVVIDQGTIIDALLLPHPADLEYSFLAPTVVRNSACSDDISWWLEGHGNGYVEVYGNPGTVTLEPRDHGFYHNLRLVRKYPSGQEATRTVQFVEFFGTPAPEHFSPALARRRAALYASRWAVRALTGGQTTQIQGVRSAIAELRSLIETPGVLEASIEALVDNHPWILERGLGYARYTSQVQVPEHVLSRSTSAVRPDKLLERHDGYHDVLDLKRADVQLIVGSGNRSRQSAAVTEAEAQVETYVRFLEEPDVRSYLASLAIKVLRPVGIVIIGRRPIDESVWEDVKSRLSVIAHTYDDLLQELEAVMKWVEQVTDSDSSAA